MYNTYIALPSNHAGRGRGGFFFSFPSFPYVKSIDETYDRVKQNRLVFFFPFLCEIADKFQVSDAIWLIAGMGGKGTACKKRFGTMRRAAVVIHARIDTYVFIFESRSQKNSPLVRKKKSLFLTPFDERGRRSGGVFSFFFLKKKTPLNL